jgi:pantoate--beta-alanine ligase
MQVRHTIYDFSIWRSSIAAGNLGQEHSHDEFASVLGFVPTMGALHEGHIALIREAKKRCRYVIVSIFVNPLQFGPSEDFSKYPRPLQADLEICQTEGADLVFNPSVEELYPAGQENLTRVIPPESLTSTLCGKFRPGHFTGVATVVLKLLNIVQPDTAFFGEKDYQQLTVIRRMVSDLNIPVEVVAVPTVRESDGLALSSRNVYLTARQRQSAPVLYETLCKVRNKCIVDSNGSLQASLETARNEIAALPDVQLQYLEACDIKTLKPLSKPAAPLVILIAAKFGNVRLIDNVVIEG